MIITVTMNPAIDKTVDIGTFTHGGLNRIRRMEKDAGGKGINVSKTICQLGGNSLAVGFLAGNAGRFIDQTLRSYGIRTDFIQVEGETRTNTKIVEENGTVTELNEPGPLITDDHINELIRKLEGYADKDTLIVLAGSVPAGTDPSLYRMIIEKMHAREASVLLDADGELFLHAMKARPDIVKPNRYELEQYFQMQMDSAEHTNPLLLARRLLRQGIPLAAISMGAEGALFVSQNQILKCPGLSVKAHSTVGAGDAMVAALAYGWEHKMTLKDCAALGMAASAGAVTTIGTKPPTRELVDELMGMVVFEELTI